jgi:flagellar hook-basal body complex protein FliE
MNEPITSVREVFPNETSIAAPRSGAKGGFSGLLDEAVRHVEASRAANAESIDKFLKGGGEEIHSLILATQKAELEFEMFLQVRNKVVQAYQELMRMQI